MSDRAYLALRQGELPYYFVGFGCEISKSDCSLCRKVGWRGCIAVAVGAGGIGLCSSTVLTLGGFDAHVASVSAQAINEVVSFTNL